MESESKRSEPRDSDRLSELHDSLIFNIFEFLPMKYVVRTQILSHRWKNLWTLTPFLHFHNEENDRDNTDFGNLVNRALLFWRGTKVQKFKVSGVANEYLPDYYSDDEDDTEYPLFIDIDSWLSFAVNYGVEELDFSFGCRSDENDRKHRAPQYLYSCSSLKRLSLSWTNIHITGKAVQWNQLLNLTIQGFEITSRVVEQILRGSPLLEVFNLSIEQSEDNVKLNFKSSNLKVLSIHKVYLMQDSRPFMDTELRIWTPNLKSLRIQGMPYGMCLLKNVSSLTHATIWFDELHDWDEMFVYDEFDVNRYLEETLRQILPAIQHVEGLTLSEWCIQVLGNMKNECLLSPFPNVKFLSLNGSLTKCVQILDLLEIFPIVETLVVKEDVTQYCRVESNLKFKPVPSILFLERLRTIEVTWSQYNFSIFPLIKSLLRYARKLKQMVFRLKEITRYSPPPNSLFLASQKLLRMPRSSPTAELIFCDTVSKDAVADF